MDKMKDLDGDGWHAYVYWSQCFHSVQDEPVNAVAMQRIMGSCSFPVFSLYLVSAYLSKPLPEFLSFAINDADIEREARQDKLVI